MYCTVKPKEFEEEELDPNDPNSLYFLYICRKNHELVRKKKLKEKKILAGKNKKQTQEKTIKAPNLK